LAEFTIMIRNTYRQL